MWAPSIEGGLEVLEVRASEDSRGCERAGAGRRQGVAAEFFLAHDRQSVPREPERVLYPGRVEGLRRALRNPIGWLALIIVEAVLLIGVADLVPLADRRSALIGVAVVLVVANYVVRRTFLNSR